MTVSGEQQTSKTGSNSEVSAAEGSSYAAAKHDVSDNCHRDGGGG